MAVSERSCRFVGHTCRRGVAHGALVPMLLFCMPSWAGAEYALNDLDQMRLVDPGSDGWRVAVGGAVGLVPEYVGASSYRNLFLPLVEASWEDRLHISVLSGIRYDLVPDSTWEIGPLVRLMTGRPNEGALSAIDEVDGGLAGGVYAGYRLGSVHFRAEAISALSGDISGGEVVMSATWRGQLAPRWIASFGPAVIWKSDSRMRDLFGVTSAEAEILGVPAYQPDSSLSSLRLSGSLTYIFNQNWSSTLIGIGTLLRSDAADSPVVDQLGDETYGILGLTLNYRF